MAIKKFMTGFICGLLGFLTLSGQSAKTDEAGVAKAVSELYAAMVDKNRDVLHKLTSENLDYGHSSGTLEDKAQFIDAVLNGSFDYISIDPEAQSINLLKDIATVRHIFVSKGTDAGNPSEVRIGALLVFIKDEATWKLLARQAYKL